MHRPSLSSHSLACSMPGRAVSSARLVESSTSMWWGEPHLTGCAALLLSSEQDQTRTASWPSSVAPSRSPALTCEQVFKIRHANRPAECSDQHPLTEAHLHLGLLPPAAGAVAPRRRGFLEVSQDGHTGM
jgi:hypothetical protein